jgi:hypothetical protein
VDIALSHLLKDRESIWSNVSGYLFAHYSWDDRVKAAALGSLYEERCNWGAVAAAYGDEVRVNRAIFDVCACLPACLREVIALYLGECGDSNAEFALSVLQKYRVEAEQEVRVQASLSYHRLLDATGHDTATALAKLTDDIVARDPLIDAMRQAAYAGLAVLGRLDVVRDAQERTDSSVPFHIVHMSSRGTSAAAVRYTIENWTAATSSLGEMVIDLFSPWGRDRSNAWNEFCRFADEHEAASREALMHLEESEPSHVGANTLRFLGRIRPGSALLARYCLAAVQLAESFNLDYWDEAVVATEILGDQFNGRGDLLTQLLEGHSMDMLPGALIVTACEMATDDDTIHSMQMALAARQRRLSYTAAFHLLGRIGEQEDVVLALHRYFRDGRPWLCQIGPVARPIIRRLRRDEDLADSLMEKLQNSPNASEKASLPRLLAVGRGLTPRLREWCMAELERQLGSQAVAEVGVDVVSRQVQPVAWSLLSLVT